MDELSKNFLSFRTGDICLSAGENIGDIMIFVGRHSTIQHSCILVWLDVNALKDNKVKVHPNYIDENTTTLSFLGLAEGRKLDMVTNELQKGLILYNPEELFINAPIVYVRALNKEYISDAYVTTKMEEYIEMHHLKMQYAYGKLHIVTVGLGFDVFGRHADNGKLCSENLYLFLQHLCGFPEFRIEDILNSDKVRIEDIDSDANAFRIENIVTDSETQINTKCVESKTFNRVENKVFKNIQYEEYKVPDALDYMYVPDFFSSDYNTHPVFEKEEVRVIGTKNEEDITVKHPYFVVFVVLVIIILFLFFVISNYCESCRATGFCRIGSKDFFDLL